MTTPVTIPKFNCLRCGHEWVPRIENPVECPKCKSYLWDKPKGEAKDGVD